MNFNSQKRLIHNPFKTNPKFRSPLLAKTLISLFLVVIPMIIIFVLLGEINILGQNGIVGANGKWYGEGFNVVNSNIQFKKDFFKWLIINPEELFPGDSVNQNKIIEFLNKIKDNYGFGFGEKPLTSYPVWVAMFVDLAAVLIICIIIASTTPKIRWDILTPVVSSWFGLFIMIISGFIPSETWGYIVRFLILAVSFIIPILIMTKLTNAIMARSKNFEKYVVDMYNEHKDSEKYYYEAAKSRLELKQKANQKTRYKVEKKDK